MLEEELALNRSWRLYRAVLTGARHRSLHGLARHPVRDGVAVTESGKINIENVRVYLLHPCVSTHDYISPAAPVAPLSLTKNDKEWSVPCRTHPGLTV